MSIENSVRLIGNLGNDVDLKFTQAGTAVATISLATTSRRKDKDGQQIEETSWHRIKAFGSLAEICDKYLRKGSKIAVEGTIRYGKYEKDGIERYTTDILIDQMQMLDKKPQDGERTDQPARAARAQRPEEQAPVDDFADDDLPF